jgi:hypothetical protein
VVCIDKKEDQNESVSNCGGDSRRFDRSGGFGSSEAGVLRDLFDGSVLEQRVLLAGVFVHVDQAGSPWAVCDV